MVFGLSRSGVDLNLPVLEQRCGMEAKMAALGPVSTQVLGMIVEVIW